MKTEYICWAGHIGIFAFLRILLLRIFVPFRRVRYFTVHPKILRLSETTFKFLFQFENVFLINNVTPHEEMVVANKAYEDAAQFVENVVKPSDKIKSLLKHVPVRYNPATIELFIKQELSLELELPMRIFNAIALHQKRDKSEAKAKNVVVIKDIHWISYLRKHFKNPADIYTYPNVKEFFNKVYAFVKLIIEVLLNSLLLIIGRQIEGAKKSAVSKIAVLHVQGANFDKRTDYFWFPGSGLKPEQVIVYFKYSAKPPKPEAISHIERTQIQWVNLLPVRIGSKRWTGGTAEFNFFPSLQYIGYLGETLWSSFRLIFVCISTWKKECWAYWKVLTVLLSTANLFEAFFRAYHVKAHFGMHEGGRDMVAANLAMECVGGVDFTTHWSSFDVVTLPMGKTHDVCFTWGPFYTKNFFSKPYYTVRNFIYSGYLFDSFFEGRGGNAGELRQKMIDEGAAFVVCLLDQNTPADRPLWNREVEKMYRRLFEMVINDSEIGLIVKPKKVNPKFKLPKLRPLIEEAEATGRCVLLAGDVFPCEAAQASDMTVGLAICSTASVEAALAGVPSITYDLEEHKDHLFYQRGLNQIVFNDLDKMFASLEGYRKDRRLFAQLGDHKEFFKEIDPFNDRKSSQRIGRYMRDVLDSLSQGGTKQEAIRQANAAYRASYGADKVVEKV